MEITKVKGSYRQINRHKSVKCFEGANLSDVFTEIGIDDYKKMYRKAIDCGLILRVRLFAGQMWSRVWCDFGTVKKKANALVIFKYIFI